METCPAMREQGRWRSDIGPLFRVIEALQVDCTCLLSPMFTSLCPLLAVPGPPAVVSSFAYTPSRLVSNPPVPSKIKALKYNYGSKLRWLFIPSCSPSVCHLSISQGLQTPRLCQRDFQLIQPVLSQAPQ